MSELHKGHGRMIRANKGYEGITLVLTLKKGYTGFHFSFAKKASAVLVLE